MDGNLYGWPLNLIYGTVFDVKVMRKRIQMKKCTVVIINL